MIIQERYNEKISEVKVKEHLIGKEIERRKRKNFDEVFGEV